MCVWGGACIQGRLRSAGTRGLCRPRPSGAACVVLSITAPPGPVRVSLVVPAPALGACTPVPLRRPPGLLWSQDTLGALTSTRGVQLLPQSVHSSSFHWGALHLARPGTPHFPALASLQTRGRTPSKLPSWAPCLCVCWESGGAGTQTPMLPLWD